MNTRPIYILAMSIFSTGTLICAISPGLELLVGMPRPQTARDVLREVATRGPLGQIRHHPVDSGSPTSGLTVADSGTARTTWASGVTSPGRV